MLEHNGFRVDVPKQDCCGLPLQSNGMFDAARALRRSAWRKHAGAARARRATTIVGTSTSCTLMLKREAREILGLDDDPDLRVVAERTYDICEFLLDLHDRGELRTDFQPLPMTRHLPRALPAAGPRHRQAGARPAGARPRAASRSRTTRRCCGVAGTYGLKKEKYQIAMDVGAGLFGADRATPSPTSRCATRETCRWHIEKATGVTTVHPVEILHRAYGL